MAHSDDSKATLDLVILLDTTQSMGEYIDSAKKNIVEICSVLRVSGRLKQENGLQVGLIAYRDYPEDKNGYIIKDYPFTEDLKVLEEYIAPLQADKGEDFPEAFSTALDFAYNNLKWREDSLKAIIVVTDAAPHGVEKEFKGRDKYDHYPSGAPEGVSVEDPLRLAKDMMELGYSIFVLACEPTLATTTNYAVDFYRAISDRTLGRFCCMTDHRMLPAYIIGTLLEKIDLRMLSIQYEEHIRRQIFDEGLSVEQVVKDLHNELQDKRELVTNLQTGEIYKDLPDARDNYLVFMKSRLLTDAKPQLKDANGQISDAVKREIQRHKRNLDKNDSKFLVHVRFRNMGAMGSGRIVLQTFDEILRTMYPEDVVMEGEPIEKMFKINTPVNFTVTYGRKTQNFSRVFVDNMSINVDDFFV